MCRGGPPRRIAIAGSRLCACKQSGNVPYCDGTHKQFPVELVGTEAEAAPAPTNALPQAKPTPEEPTVAFIHDLAEHGLTKFGHHGPMTSMGVPRNLLPHWDDLQIMAAQMATKPLLEDQAVGTELVGTGICSGEGGMLPEEQEANSRYFYELASAEFGYREDLLTKVQAFHFKGGQGAKTGTGGHLPGNKNKGKISLVRGIPEGEPAACACPSIS